ncbi:chromosomal replication initiator protein DnaA [Candidatus Nomurabacteria bacterium]|nr:chromosomal replication initiator protein DnaA [Candidatus Nomurabacteria bacterium]
MIETKELWGRCLKEIEQNVTKANFSTWFKNTAIIKEDEGSIYIGVPNEFVKEWLQNKFHKLIVKTLVEQVPSIRSVEYSITKLSDKKEIQESRPLITEHKTELPLRDLYINKDDNLNPKYTFDNFIVGPFNQLPYAASQAIIERPASIYNPFFVYGNTGLGKTHLIQSVGNALKKNFPDKKVFYVTLEKFAIDYTDSLAMKNTNTSFKEKYRKYDVLIIDDIQFIDKMEKTQDELFHLFNVFYENNKQIIFSSDKHPNHIKGLEERLKSRFAQGMIVDVTEPDYESRVAILKGKAAQQITKVSQEVVMYLAGLIQGNIRELEGALNIIVCQTEIKGRQLTEEEVRLLVKNSIKPKKSVSIEEVTRKIAEHFHLDESSIYEKTRRKEIVEARQMIMYILREDFNISYPLIGQKLGGKDHTTVMHSCDKIKRELKDNMVLNQDVEKIRTMFK